MVEVTVSPSDKVVVKVVVHEEVIVSVPVKVMVMGEVHAVYEIPSTSTEEALEVESKDELDDVMVVIEPSDRVVVLSETVQVIPVESVSVVVHYEKVCPSTVVVYVDEGEVVLHVGSDDEMVTV